MPERKNSEARIRANNKYNAKAYDRINIAIPKGKKDIIKAAADAVSESINAYINTAVDMRMGAAAMPASAESAPGASLPADILNAAQDAAEAAAETVPDFMRRAVAEQAHRDKLTRKLQDNAARSAAK